MCRALALAAFALLVAAAPLGAQQQNQSNQRPGTTVPPVSPITAGVIGNVSPGLLPSNVFGPPDYYPYPVIFPYPYPVPFYFYQPFYVPVPVPGGQPYPQQQPPTGQGQPPAPQPPAAKPAPAPQPGQDDLEQRSTMYKFLREGNGFFAAGKYKEALKSYDAAVAAAPLEPLAAFHQGQAYLALGQYGKAVTS